MPDGELLEPVVPHITKHAVLSQLAAQVAAALPFCFAELEVKPSTD